MIKLCESITIIYLFSDFDLKLSFFNLKYDFLLTTYINNSISVLKATAMRFITNVLKYGDTMRKVHIFISNNVSLLYSVNPEGKQFILGIFSRCPKLRIG